MHRRPQAGRVGGQLITISNESIDIYYFELYISLANTANSAITQLCVTTVYCVQPYMYLAWLHIQPAGLLPVDIHLSWMLMSILHAHAIKLRAKVDLLQALIIVLYSSQCTHVYYMYSYIYVAIFGRMYKDLLINIPMQLASQLQLQLYLNFNVGLISFPHFLYYNVVQC